MKERITISIEKEFLKWLDERTDIKVFANRSHGFEFLIKRAQMREEKNAGNTQEEKGAQQ